jgi:DUF1680 family protein
VRLLAGPFLDAQQRDLAYLLSLEPDRLLHNFRVNAGLPPKAPVYGGWESEEPWVGIRCQGHTLGHYLSATSLMHASTGDARMKARADYIVDELHACQRRGRGSCAGFPTARRSSMPPSPAAGSSACRGTRCTRSSPACAMRICTARVTPHVVCSPRSRTGL